MLNVTESNLTDIHQLLDLWTGKITSKFSFEGTAITVETTCAQTEDTIGVTVTSPLLRTGRLGLFLDFPWNDGSSKFSAPFVGNWTLPANHSTTLVTHTSGDIQAQITHKLNTATFLTSIESGDKFTITRDSPTAHRYSITPEHASSFSVSAKFGLHSPSSILSPGAVAQSSAVTWNSYWSNSGFVDVSQGSTDSRANELQRRIILSRYLLRVNEAGDTPPQEVCTRLAHSKDLSERCSVRTS